MYICMYIQSCMAYPTVVASSREQGTFHCTNGLQYMYVGPVVSITVARPPAVATRTATSQSVSTVTYLWVQELLPLPACLPACLPTCAADVHVRTRM